MVYFTKKRKADSLGILQKLGGVCVSCKEGLQLIENKVAPVQAEVGETTAGIEPRTGLGFV